MLPDTEFAENAIVLAKAGRYQEALAVLDLLQDPNTAVALNYRGFATRKLGRLEEGIGYYLKSVALDPNYAQVREYLGEAYVQKGDMARAKAQLQKIETICGTGCEEYTDLAEAIADPRGRPRRTIKGWRFRCGAGKILGLDPACRRTPMPTIDHQELHRIVLRVFEAAGSGPSEAELIAEPPDRGQSARPRQPRRRNDPELSATSRGRHASSPTARAASSARTAR